MDHAKIELMRQSYAAVARQYRENDERDVTGPDHQRLGSILSSICCSFHRPITALDIGCGTGRFFHCLSNVRKLVGMDVSEAMLTEARSPVCAHEISVQDIELRCENFYTAGFPHASFDFIYSIGVFGNGCGLSVEVCNKFYHWLTPDGCLFVDAIDSSGAPLTVQLRRHTKRVVYGMLPRKLQNAWDHRSGWLPMFVTSRRHLTRLFHKTHFPHFSIQSMAYHLPTGMGRKLECFASKISRHWQPKVT